MGRYMTNLLRAANTHLASHTKSHTDGLGRKGLVQEPNAFYLSTLETHETQAMLNDDGRIWQHLHVRKSIGVPSWSP